MMRRIALAMALCFAFNAAWAGTPANTTDKAAGMAAKERPAITAREPCTGGAGRNITGIGRRNSREHPDADALRREKDQSGRGGHPSFRESVSQ